MTNAFVWTLQDVVSIAMLALILVVVALIFLTTFVREMLCKHDAGVNETQACDAICRNCGKNLGFIGAWRKTQENKGK